MQQYLPHCLKKINAISEGETVLLSSNDFMELHKYLITVFASVLDKGKVTNKRWTEKQWDNVLKHVEECYSGKSDTFEVSRMIKK